MCVFFFFSSTASWSIATTARSSRKGFPKTSSRYVVVAVADCLDTFGCDGLDDGAVALGTVGDIDVGGGGADAADGDGGGGGGGDGDHCSGDDGRGGGGRMWW